MAFPDDPKGVPAPSGEPSPVSDAVVHPVAEHAANEVGHPEAQSVETAELQSYEDSWSSGGQPAAPVSLTPAAPPPPRPPSPPPPPDPEDEEEEGMLRMSFMEHLEELRKRILLALAGLAVAFIGSMSFAPWLWDVVQQPAHQALVNLNINPPDLVLISPMDGFQIIWMKLPLLCAIFLGSPWILYQVWAFIAPGLYERERRWAAPFVLSSAGLFIAGGLFAYFIAFRSGLEFLLGIGLGHGIRPGLNVTEYYDLFVDVMLGVGIVFEIPVLLFLLTLIRVANPAFLVRHSRYAILAIVALAAVITPTGDIFNLALFATPMIILFYVGIFASYLLVLHRENRRFPWATFLMWFAIILVVASGIMYVIARHYGYHFTGWPLFSK